MIELVKDCITDFDIQDLNNYLIKSEIFCNPVHDFEETLKSYFNFPFCYAVNSGSSALHIALLSLGLKEGDEVICTTYTCIAILNAIKYVNLKPILVDINYDPTLMNYNINLDLVEAKISKKTKAIIIPHMFGVPVEFEKIRRKGIVLIEDITLSLGAKFQDGKYVGTKGDLSVASFHKTKMISAGSGGVIIINNEKYLKSVSNYLDYDGIYKTSYKITFNYTMGDINSVIAKSQLLQLDKFIEMRNNNANIIMDCLVDCKSVIIPRIKNGIYFRYIVEINSECSAKSIVDRGLKFNIQFGRGVFPAIHNVLNDDISNYPMAEKAQKKLVSIPVYPGLKESEIIYMCENLKKIIKE